eukprot:403374773
MQNKHLSSQQSPDQTPIKMNLEQNNTINSSLDISILNPEDLNKQKAKAIEYDKELKMKKAQKKLKDKIVISDTNHHHKFRNQPGVGYYTNKNRQQIVSNTKFQSLDTSLDKLKSPQISPQLNYLKQAQQKTHDSRRTSLNASISTLAKNLDQSDHKQMQRAFSTYLNVTGPGDYTLPSLVSTKGVTSNKKNSPAFTFQQKTKLPYFPQTESEFMGKDSPAPIEYSPEPNLLKQKDPSYTIGSFQRFHLNKDDIKLKSQMPISYDTDLIKNDKNVYKHVGFGFGNKIQLKTSKADQQVPGPTYKNEYFNSIQHVVDKTQNKKDSTFGVNKEQGQKIVYSGQERALLGTQSPGPVIYSSCDNLLSLSNVKRNSRYSIPKQDRGLLRKSIDNSSPSPLSYNNPTDIYKTHMSKREASFKMPTSQRKFDFTRFNPLNRDIIEKGLL